MTLHYILSRRLLDTEIITTKTPHFLLHDERLDVRHAKGGVKADKRVEGLKEDGLGGRVDEEFHGTWMGALERAGRGESEVYSAEGGRGRCEKCFSSAIRNRVGRRAHWL